MLNLTVEEVFVTEGVPAFTFVRPPNYNRIFVDVRSAGKPVILEGQSGTGKTTCIKQIIKDLADSGKTTYYTAREPVDVSSIERIVRERLVGRFVIDDFHRLSLQLQEDIANLAKAMAEAAADTARAKLIIVGINQVGSGLIQLVPDIAKRVGIHKIDPGSLREIDQIISNGEDKLNVKLGDHKIIFEETQGDYWLTQQLCQSICLANNILNTQGNSSVLNFDIASIRRDVVSTLQAAHYPAVKDFCRGNRFRPSNQPYYKLLRGIGQKGRSNVDLNELANADQDLRGSINNIKEYRLPLLIASKPSVARSFYYNRDTKSFSIDDPALFYFIKHLNWDQLRQDCGFRDELLSYEFDIAISFAGEKRELARHIATQLIALDVPVFFDEHFEVNFLGQAWRSTFKEIFRSKSRYVVCLLDEFHSEKIWPTFEREHFVNRVSDGQVIPIYLDNTVFVGIPSDIVGIKLHFDPSDENWRPKVDKDIVEKLIDKIT